MIKNAIAQIKNPALSGPLAEQRGSVNLAFLIGQLWKSTVVIGGIAFLLFFVWGGLEWVLAGGDPKKIDTAQKKITQGLIGLVFLVASYAIISFIQDILGINILNIDWTFGSAN